MKRPLESALAYAVGALAFGHYLVLSYFGDWLNVGTLFSLGLALACVALGLWWRRAAARPPAASKLRRGIRRLATVLFVAWGLSFLVCCALFVYHGRAVVPEGLDYVLVLGAGRKSGRPTATLALRLDLAARLYHEERVRLVVCGGKGPDEEGTEAELMKSYLVARGVAGEDILTEDASTSTFENLRFAREKLARLDADLDERRLGVITSDFHMLRARLIGRRVGLDLQPVPSPTPVWVWPNVYFREYFALIKTLLFDDL